MEMKLLTLFVSFLGYQMIVGNPLRDSRISPCITDATPESSSEAPSSNTTNKPKMFAKPEPNRMSLDDNEDEDEYGEDYYYDYEDDDGECDCDDNECDCDDDECDCDDDDCDCDDDDEIEFYTLIKAGHNY